ncbi:MAG: cell division protein [Acidobacteria bacterium]|nr:MAG: cell division protein [Acidobacteriota bacterium]REK02116.1 MAG: cell division protein [Acidobacteriota bacterium]REK14082.1 MAG: cell division protein [Acidobacteriota bacterium]REK42077.1 MAG: cell division protein [Acidobacteriota bacterium]
MQLVQLITRIKASPKICFDLSRDIDFHTRSMGSSDEKAVGGVKTGLIGIGHEVTFRGKHFGIYHEHTSRITAFNRPLHFRDEMVSGRFRSFVHDHYFEEIDGETVMRDVIEFQSPFWIFGVAVDAIILKAYLQRLIETRNEALKNEAERLQEISPLRGE